MTERMRPRVSIALCTFNGEQYLREQLDSVLTQTYRWHELIIVDDCSTDQTLAILKQYAEQDSRISVFRNDANVGLNRNFMGAMSRCSGDFIAPCDQDDIWHADKLEILVDSINGHSLAYCDSELISGDGAPMGDKISDCLSMISTNNVHCMTFRNCVPGHASLIRSDVVRNAPAVPDEFYYDWWLAAVAASLNGIVYIDRPLVRHRRHHNNSTNLLSRAMLPDRKAKQAGYKLKRFHEQARRIAALAGLQSNNKHLLCNLLELWSAREAQWVCPRLAWLVLTNGIWLCAPQKNNSLLSAARLAYISFWGIKAKRLINSHAYEM